MRSAFDLLWLDGEDLRDFPLWERKKILEGCLRQPPERILYVNHVEEEGEELFRQVCELDLEGIVCKRRLSLYCGKWIKVKNLITAGPRDGANCCSRSGAKCPL